MGDDDLKRMFDQLAFRDEPPMRSSTRDDVHRGRRRLRRRRITGFSAAAGASAAVVMAALLLPGGAADDHPRVDVASSDDGQANPETVAVDDGDKPFATTYRTLAAVVTKHLDPEGDHLEVPAPRRAEQTGPTAWQVSDKLAWTNPGEDGTGMVRVIVTLPGYAAQDHAYSDIATQIGCEINADTGESANCVEREASDGRRLLVSRARPDLDLVFGVMHERDDGSFAAVAVHDLFGNNSLEPVSSVDITREQAVDFVTDPELRVDPDEAEAELRREPEEPVETPEPERSPVYPDTEIAAAPEVKEMAPDELRGEFDDCVDGVPAWSDFTPTFGYSFAPQSGDPYATDRWLIAERGASKLLCAGDVELFDGPGAKAKIDDETVIDALGSDDFGVYGEDVSKVTLQLIGEPERAAMMRDGFWYLPVPHDRPDRGTVLRAYDADGELIHEGKAIPEQGGGGAQ